MWLINSPIGRKVVMSLTGICLILFLTFHCCMNVAAFFSGHAYNMVCEFLGSNWYAVLGTLGLAFLAVCHIVYAFILTAQNRRARGPVVPPLSWLLVSNADLGLERQDLAEALAVHRHRLCHHPHGRVRLPGIVILVWFRAQLLIVDSKYSF